MAFVQNKKNKELVSSGITFLVMALLIQADIIARFPK